jgi:NAD(P)-dependent dehydrogenase (short-subunit alcohol dehydrogenase family)
MKQVIVITGASSDAGKLAAKELAKAGHIVYAGVRGTKKDYAVQVRAAKKFSAHNNADLRTIELDAASGESVELAIRHIVKQNGRLDVVIHNAGQMVFGPAEAFTPEQLAQLYDINVLGTQRVNRAVLPVLREQGQGLVVWVSSSCAQGGPPPYLGPYFAVKAGMDALAASYAAELARWNIETTIVIPGAFTASANHFGPSRSPRDKARSKQYASGPTARLARQVIRSFELAAPAEPDASKVASAIASVIEMPFGTRPFRVHIDPDRDRTEIVNGVADRVRAQMLRSMGLADLLNPSSARAGIEVYA